MEFQIPIYVFFYKGKRMIWLKYLFPPPHWCRDPQDWALGSVIRFCPHYVNRAGIPLRRKKRADSSLPGGSWGCHSQRPGTGCMTQAQSLDGSEEAHHGRKGCGLRFLFYVEHLKNTGEIIRGDSFLFFSIHVLSWVFPCHEKLFTHIVFKALYFMEQKSHTYWAVLIIWCISALL